MAGSSVGSTLGPSPATRTGIEVPQVACSTDPKECRYSELAFPTPNIERVEAVMPPTTGRFAGIVRA